jgi:hypothetical protein
MVGGLSGPSSKTTVSSPVRTRGQNLWHSCEQSFGLHRSLSKMAIRILCSTPIEELFGVAECDYLALWLDDVINGKMSSWKAFCAIPLRFQPDRA